PPRRTLFPYTTLFRSARALRGGGPCRQRLGAQHLGGHARVTRRSHEAAGSAPPARRVPPQSPPCRLVMGRRSAVYSDSALTAARSEEHTSELQSRENL